MPLMKIDTFGVVAPEVTEAAKTGRLPRYLVCGVDVYSSALAPIPANDSDKKKRPPVVDRHYRLIDLINPDEYIPCTTIADLIAEIKARVSDLTNFRLNFLDEEAGAETGEIRPSERPGETRPGELPNEIKEFDDSETIFKLTSLTREELVELMKG